MVWIGSTTTAVNNQYLAPCPPKSYRKETKVNHLQQSVIGIDECISFPVSSCRQISMGGELGRSQSVIRGRFFLCASEGLYALYFIIGGRKWSLFCNQ